MVCQEDPLVKSVCELYEKISNLETLKPCKDVNTLFTQLVLTCIPPYPVDVTNLCKKVQDIRTNLIKLCGQAEGLLESHYSTILGLYKNPLDHLEIFPYYSNYLKLSLLEFNILIKYCPQIPNKIAFLGSGPLPLTSIVLATNHMTNTVFHNYDIDPKANSKAFQLISPHTDLSKRMFFHTIDVMKVTNALKDYDVVFLAALVGMDKEEKIMVIDHLSKYMAPGAILMLRSAHGARAFLYPVINPGDLNGFDVLSVYHPTDDVINSVVIARKKDGSIPNQQQGVAISSNLIMPNKCVEIQAFNIFSNGNIAEDLAIEEQVSRT